MSPRKGKDWAVSAGLCPNSPLMSSVILDKSINSLEASFLPSVNGDNNNNSVLLCGGEEKCACKARSAC